MSIHRVGGYNNIFAHDSFEDEFRNIFNKSHSEYIKYQDKLDKKLNILDLAAKDAIDGKHIKKLENTNPRLYRIAFPGKINPRVIFFILEEDEEEVFILLTAMRETKKSDYDVPKKTSKQRAKEIRKEL